MVYLFLFIYLTLLLSDFQIADSLIWIKKIKKRKEEGGLFEIYLHQARVLIPRNIVEIADKTFAKHAIGMLSDSHEVTIATA